ncbi:hypothetical protein BZA70DRAFT_273640 [Myxozyma melibiosi]|uniref:CBM20 domain-containing protein n=1 Tax=Myxozyma melibiosi TaxID=54550 RepID=A0ABR1FEW8_9ASCO
MGGFSYTFKWPADPPANEVYVTGSFDNWSKSAPLVKETDGSWTVSVPLPKEKITYKFVVDDQWLVDPNAKIERDSSGVENNVIDESDVSALSSSSGVIPESGIPIAAAAAAPAPAPTATADSSSSEATPAAPAADKETFTTEDHINALNAAPGIVIPSNIAQIPYTNSETNKGTSTSTTAAPESLNAFSAAPGPVLPNNPQMLAAFDKKENEPSSTTAPTPTTTAAEPTAAETAPSSDAGATAPEATPTAAAAASPASSEAKKQKSSIFDKTSSNTPTTKIDRADWTGIAFAAAAAAVLLIAVAAGYRYYY